MATGSGFDGLNMRPGDVGETMRRLGAAEQDMTATWATARTTISALEGQLGQGQLGQAFMGRYRAGADQAARAADQWVAQPADLARAGEQGVEAYVRTDGDVSGALGSLA